MNHYVSYLMIICQLLLNEGPSITLLEQTCQQQSIPTNTFFSSILDSLLQCFDASGGGAVGYLRRSLFVQSMLYCILHGESQELERLEEVMDCAVSVFSEEEVGEEKLRLLHTEKTIGGNELLSTKYLNKFASQSNLRNYLTNSLSVCSLIAILVMIFRWFLQSMGNRTCNRCWMECIQISQQLSMLFSRPRSF